MQKIRIALLIGDAGYRNRLSSHILLHEKHRFELHLFSDAAQLSADKRIYDVVLCADCIQEALFLKETRQEPFLYLADLDEKEERLPEYEEKLRFIEKYQNVNAIVDEILSEVGSEVCQVKEGKKLLRKSRVIGVYALSENEYQLPFLVTLASVLGEQNRVLILDLQENSGFLHLPQACREPESGGMEELLAMAESKQYTRSRIFSCIGHLDDADFVYPAQNSECLCEATSTMYLRLLQIIAEEFDYSMILLNMGSRFQGFFEVLNQCQNIYMMSKNRGLCQWREYEFAEEAKKRGYEQIMERITKVEIPISTIPMNCERIVEQWKWNELGDMIRRMLLQPMRAEGTGA